MEDMARLALVEQDLQNRNNFSHILLELLQFINIILDNPHESDLRTITNDILLKVLDCGALVDYLKYVGFEKVDDKFIYPKEQSLNKLRIAQAALERKVLFISGSTGARPKENIKRINNKLEKNKNSVTPLNVLTTKNSFLLRIQSFFNNMLIYEDNELQQAAREQIPLVTLQLMALDRMREQQKKIKIGELKEPDMPFDSALLMELMNWFKYKFFTWVDQPDCDKCGGITKHVATNVQRVKSEVCNVEEFACTEAGCGGRALFPRLNNPRGLLETRSGRCGEWANCFTLLCRALGYDTRYIFDTTDHVWCEVWDYDTKKWLHVDPCEASINAPLTYSHGWNKKLSYVFAFSWDDLQDVTWRYTTNHKEVLSRRTDVTETELLNTILVLREARHAQLSAARRQYLTTRNLGEIAELMVERKPSDYEGQGRISGSKEWRTQRGEIGTNKKGYTFEMSVPGHHLVQYYPTTDAYRITCSGMEMDSMKSWEGGVYKCENVFRKIEKDWRQVYLARQEGDSPGSVSWKLRTAENLAFDLFTIKMTTAVYENGQIDWTIQFDDDPPVPLILKDASVTVQRRARVAVVEARLAGGVGAVAWQHAQLFRQPLAARTAALEIQARVIAD